MDEQARATKLADRGKAFLLAGDFSAAEQQLLDCVKATVELPECHRMLGVLYAQMSNKQGLLEHYREYDTASSSDSWSGTSNKQKSLRHYRRYLELRPNAPDAKVIRAAIEGAESTEPASTAEWKPSDETKTASRERDEMSYSQLQQMLLRLRSSKEKDQQTYHQLFAEIDSAANELPLKNGHRSRWSSKRPLSRTTSMRSGAPSPSSGPRSSDIEDGLVRRTNPPTRGEPNEIHPKPAGPGASLTPHSASATPTIHSTELTSWPLWLGGTEECSRG
jgi:tetratricopeptide (TPR) repeat protein